MLAPCCATVSARPTPRWSGGNVAAPVAWTGGPAGVPRPPDRRSGDRRIVGPRARPSRARAGRASVPGRPPGRARRPAGIARDRGPLPAPGRGARGARGRPRRDARDGDRQREVTRVPARVRPRRAHRPESHGVVPLPDEGPRARPAPLGPFAQAPATQSVRLRRGHAAGGTPADPDEREPRADQPRHAPRVAAPRPRPVGRLLLTAVPRGGRRGARAPRRLRLPGRDGPPPAPAVDRRTRRRPPLVPRHRYGREPGGAGLPPHGSGRRGRRARRVAARPEALRALEPTGDRRGDRGTAERVDGSLIGDDRF